MSSARVEVLRSQLPSYNEVKLKHYDELRRTIKAMTAPGKGLLAADESVGSVTKRFAGINLENNAENRRKYRALMVGAEGLEKFISGVIFHEETLDQKMDDGNTFPAYLNKIGIVPGIKTDGGVAPLEIGAPEEQMTQGLDNYVKRAYVFVAIDANVPAARKVFLHRAAMNSAAERGQYDRAQDQKDSKSLYVKGNSY